MPSNYELVEKMWYIHRMEYYSVIKINEIMLFANKWMELEIIMLSEARLRRTKVTCFPSYVKARPVR
jgi:hypothetical protein